MTKLQNRVRQKALRVREGERLPSEYSMFVLVTYHLFKNSHRYFGFSQPSELQQKLIECNSISDETKQNVLADFKEASRRIRDIGTLKSQNRVDEQQQRVKEIKNDFGSLRHISSITGVSLKTVAKWCTVPTASVKKRVELSKLRREEYEEFLNQDSISFAHPCKKYDGRRYLRYTMAETRKLYLAQPQFHKYGILSKTRMIEFRPDSIKVCGSTPLSQCLCMSCENCEKILKCLLSLSIQLIPSNRYDALQKVMCPERIPQSGTEYEFAKLLCIQGKCSDCGVDKLKNAIIEANEDVIAENKTITWRKWMTPAGKKCPENVHIKGTLSQGIDYLCEELKSLGSHMFRSQWNRNWFQYIREHLLVGYLAQIFDFSMNFRNICQDEVQAAFWNGTQTAIHCIISYLLCKTQGCKKVVTIVVCQISADLQHDSFFTRAAHEETFRLLSSMGIEMNVVVQFSDNCAAQYKSRRPFADMARSPLNLIRVYFGERHGKSQCDGFFGRLKAWMSHNIKSRNVEVKDASDFFRFCRDEYQTEHRPGTCQHYQVYFQYLEPKHIRRHQDCDLDKAIPGTRSVYSVRNTPDPLKLKIRNVPCLCPACILDDGSRCINSAHADPWKEVQLKPKAKTKFTKKRHPASYRTNESTRDDLENDNYDVIDIDMATNAEEQCPDTSDEEEFIDLTSVPTVVDEAGNGEVYVDLTAQSEDNIEAWSEEDEDLPVYIDEDFAGENGSNIAENNSDVSGLRIDSELPTFDSIDPEEIPVDVFWESILSSMEGCTSFFQLQSLAVKLHEKIPSIRPKMKEVPFKIQEEFIDAIATESLPSDAPERVDAIHTIGDGNCLCRSLSRLYCGSDEMHIELRARIVIEGIVNKDLYLSPHALENGASHIRVEETIPATYSTYSDHYINGQKLSKINIDFIYCQEMYECSKMDSYMGLWQIAQAANVLHLAIRSVYPEGGDDQMRMDFNRIFYPATCDEQVEYIYVMWTGPEKGYTPNHFVPLVKKRTKYAQLIKRIV